MKCATHIEPVLARTKDNNISSKLYFSSKTIIPCWNPGVPMSRTKWQDTYWNDDSVISYYYMGMM